MKRNKVIIANWKMNGSKQFVEDFVRELLNTYDFDASIKTVLLMPNIYLYLAQKMLQNSPISWGGQNVSQYEKGPYTGEVSTGMLHDFSCQYVLIGHSERRVHYAESDTIIADKFFRAIESDLVPIFCVGETLQQRLDNKAEETIQSQCSTLFEDSRFARCIKKKFIIAYEPIWAIGTGKVATAKEAQAMHLFIRNNLAGYNKSVAEKIAILYGGSVNTENAKGLFAQNDIDGALIGGASLKVSMFKEVLNLCSSCCL